MDESVSAQLGPQPMGDPPQRRSARRWLAVSFAVGVVVALIGTFWQVPYYTLSPGSLRNTPPLVSVEGAPTFVDDGEIGYVTVTFAQSTPFGLVRAWLDSDIEVLDEETALGGRNLDENRALNLALMDNAKEIATAVALDALGYEVRLVGTGAVIVTVEAGTPADGLLAAGDVVVGFDGSPVTTSGELVAAVRERPAGTEVVLTVERHGGATLAPADMEAAPLRDEVSLVLVASPDDPAFAYLGVRSATRDATWDLPFEVSVDSGNVIGPSAGLAFTLGIIDVLTPGSLTGGAVVAVTGTIAPNGNVGVVGGVPQKAAAAIGAGASLYLVPEVELESAGERAGSEMAVVGVATLLDALEALAVLSGDRSVVDRVASNLAARVP